jgi:sterol desaturase/sphingolipid hydroxylase (fatty acid hydroxylase superfamily)
MFWVYFIFNYNHKNYHTRICNKEYYINVIINYFISAVIFFGLYFLKISNNTSQSISLINIVLYIIISDFFSYWVHRYIHRTPHLKKNIHSLHHTNFKLIPFDTLRSHHIDHIIDIFVLHLFSNIILNLSVTDFIVASSIVTLHNFYLHSDYEDTFFLPFFINSKFHGMHHSIGGGNYSFLLKIWDNIMNTNIKFTPIV